MRRSRLDTLLIAAGLAVGVLGVTSAAGAAQPSQADIDFCNKQAAEASAKTKGSSATPATPAQPGTNVTGGRITDSTQPGAPPAEVGMAAAGQTDPVYRQAYISCIKQRS
jgi:hypothetical protein